MFLYGVGASQAIDSSGEILMIDGVDLTSVHEGKAVFNWEHSNDGSDTIVGSVTFAKKIYSAEECENERQLQCWNETQLPLVYIEGRLFDREGHAGAICLAAIIRATAKIGEKSRIGTSIEGNTLERGKGEEHHVLKKTVCRKFAATLAPCNKTCDLYLWKDDAADILKSENYNFSEIDNSKASQKGFIEIEDPIEDIYDAINELHKTLTAGSSNVAPSQMVGGAALTKENLVGIQDVGIKTRIKSAIKKWDRKKPLKEHLKAEMEDLSDKYIDTFTDLAEDLKIKKNETPIRIDESKVSKNANNDQIQLIHGINLPNNGQRFKVISSHGKMSNVKPSSLTNSGNETARNAAAYYAAAKDFFGLGENVPVTAFFHHQTAPMEGSPLFLATEHTTGHPAILGSLFEDSLLSNKDLLHKIAIMDTVLGNSNRNYSNILMGENPKLIDNENAFEYSNASPFHISICGNEIMPLSTKEWLLAKDPKKLAEILATHHVNLNCIKKALYALKIYQKMSHHPVNSILNSALITEPSPEVEDQ